MADRPLRLKADALLASPALTDDVVTALRAGGLVGVPTETVYGLGADATNPAGVAAIYAAKGRPTFNPLIAHAADLAGAEAHGVFDADARALAEAFWPGPLTLVVPRRADSRVAPGALAGLATIAIRVPDSPAVRRLAARLGAPLAAPSANRSGRVSPTSADDVVAELGAALAFVIDGGPCRIGVESTIVGLTGGAPVLLRPGGLPREAIEAVLGRPLLVPGVDPDRPSAPGQLASHYAPQAAVRLEAEEVRRGEALLAFGPLLLPGAEHAAAIRNLSTTGDLAEAAANLFAMLRALDESGAAVIAVAPIPAGGLGDAVRDRLARAAAPRAAHPLPE